MPDDPQLESIIDQGRAVVATEGIEAPEWARHWSGIGLLNKGHEEIVQNQFGAINVLDGYKDTIAEMAFAIKGLTTTINTFNGHNGARRKRDIIIKLGPPAAVIGGLGAVLAWTLSFLERLAG